MPATQPRLRVRAPRLGHTSSRPSALGSLALALAAPPLLLASVAWPLLTYTVSLAAFGLAHVLCELHYLQARFGRRVSTHLWRTLGLLLAGVVGLRLARIGGAVSGSVAGALELLLVAGLCATVVPAMWASSRRSGLLGAAATLCIVAGLAFSPLATLLLFAALHNLTPIGLLVEAAPPRQRGRTLAGTTLLFLGLPALVATGLPFEALRQLAPGMVAPEASILPAGPLQAHLGAYLPATWHSTSWALHAFSALVLAQCLHYGAVLHALPQRLAPTDRLGVFQLGIILVATLVLCASFALDFAQTRAWYGVAAAVHAWIELPILLLFLGMLPASTAALAPGAPPTQRTPP